MRWVPRPFAICYDICHPVGRALSPPPRYSVSAYKSSPSSPDRPPTRHVICYGLHPPRYLARDLARYADLLAGSSMLSSWVVWEEPPCRDAKTLPSPRTGSLHVHLYCLIFTILLCTVCTGAGRVVDVVAGSGKARNLVCTSGHCCGLWLQVSCRVRGPACSPSAEGRHRI